MKRAAALGAALAVVFAGVGCTPGGEESTVTVAAAASLSMAFERLEERFEADNPGIDLVLNFAGSGSLREQILAGAPIDVFASANMANMEILIEAGLVDGNSPVFARNRLTLAVPHGNPGGITDLEDLERDDLLVGLCAATAPCGELARNLLDGAGVEPSVDTEEPDVRALLTKLATGELDVGLVYNSEVIASRGAVVAVDLPEGLEAATAYPIAVLTDAPSPQTAALFVGLVLSAEGQSILAEAGFESP